MAFVFRNVGSLLSCKNFASRTCVAINFSSFRSNYSLDKIYPQSHLDMTTIPKPPVNENEKFSGFIPLDKIDIQYSRSTGPGGQNVNCVDTKAEIRFKLSSADWIPEKVRSKLAEDLRNQINKDGYFIIKSDRTRSQQMNLADALERLRRMIHTIADSLVVQTPSAVSLEKHRRL